MQLLSTTGLFFALSLTGQTIAELGWFCPLASDAKFTQTPFCCEGFVPARDSKVSWEGVKCEDVSKPGQIAKTCPNGGTPKCCYSIGPKQICTTEVLIEEEDE